MIKVLVVD